MKKLNGDELLQFSALNSGVNALLFLMGFFIGQSVLCGIIDLTVTQKLSNYTLTGVFMLMGALASYQLRDHFMKKLQSLVQDMK